MDFMFLFIEEWPLFKKKYEIFKREICVENLKEFNRMWFMVVFYTWDTIYNYSLAVTIFRVFQRINDPYKLYSEELQPFFVPALWELATPSAPE
jgi:hypothetical protein